MKRSRFHGRHDTTRICEAPHCAETGEFRAPGNAGSTFDGPGEWRWFCLEHVREFNAGYDWFEGMSAEEIFDAQAPGAGWRTESPTFRAAGGVDPAPRWADFADPLDAISARAGGIRNRAGRKRAMPPEAQFGKDERAALQALGLGPDADRAHVRRRYSELVRRYHPDRNGGDRKFEHRLGAVVEAYQLLRKSSALR
ncbi:MAG: J domain-containing protein [Parerythrobacter sp.]